MAVMLTESLQRIAALAGFSMLALGLVIWLVGRLASKPRLAIASSVEDGRGERALSLRVRNLRGREAQVRATYLMFASGVGMALRPALPDSAPLPLDLPHDEDAFLRYPFATAALQLSHHCNETLRAVGCLVAP